MQGIAVFNLDYAPPEGIVGVYAQGATGSSGTFAGTGTIPDGASSFSVPVAIVPGSRQDGGTAFPANLTQYLILQAAWSVAGAGANCAGPYTCIAAGTQNTSSNPIYVTLAPSVYSTQFGPVMLTYVALAVGAGGAIDQPTALANTWAQFSTGSGPANVQTWDGRPMQYYSSGFGACALSAANVVQNLDQNGNITDSGQCGSFAYLLASALAMNGIHSNWTTATPSDQTGTFGTQMVINNWCEVGQPACPAGTPTYSSQASWQYELTLNACSTCGDPMFPTATGGYGDLTNESGLPGQGETTPVEKVFACHFFLQLTFVSGNQYYDPSYGVTYPSAAGFESAAVAGYTVQSLALGDVLTSPNYHFRLASSGPPNITFNVSSLFP
jgi:hypothetical protein